MPPIATVQHVTQRIFVIIFGLMLIPFICYCGVLVLFFGTTWWQGAKFQPKSVEELLNPLTPSQIECIEQVTDKNNLVYVEVQNDPRLIAIGYNTNDQLHAAVVANETRQGNDDCNIEFNQVVATRHCR